jgi:hypothetical protein
MRSSMLMPTSTETTITKMTPDTLNFTGDGITFLGLIGVISTAIIVVTVFRSYFNSPLRK